MARWRMDGGWIDEWGKMDGWMMDARIVEG